MGNMTDVNAPKKQTNTVEQTLLKLGAELLEMNKSTERATSAAEYLRETQQKQMMQALPRWMCTTDDSISQLRRIVHALVALVMGLVVLNCIMWVWVLNQ